MSREEHQLHRTYAGNLEKELGNGKSFAKQIFTYARAVDHLGTFTYMPECDSVVIYGNPNIEAYEKGDMTEYYRSLKEDISGMVFYMTFKREKTFTSTRKVDIIKSNITLIPRGVQGTTHEMRLDGAFNSATIASDELKFLINMEITFAFLKEKVFYYTWTTITPTMEYQELKETLDALMLIYNKNEDFKDLVKEYLSMLEFFLFKKKDIQKEIPMESLHIATLSWINCIQKLDEDFFYNKVLTIYIHESPLYQHLNTYVCEQPVNVSSNDVSYDCTIIGNHTHPVLQHVIHTALEASKTSLYFNKEQKIHQMDKDKPDSMIMDWTMKTYFPEAYFSTSFVIKYGNVLIMTTEPKIEKEINWMELFEKSKNFGVLARRFQATPNCPDTILYHQKYRLPVGEGLKFPIPFKQGLGPLNSPIILKTKYHVYYYAGNAVDFTQTHLDKYMTKAEWGYVFGMACPFTVSEAFTYHHAQGSTIKTGVFMDLDKLTTKNGGLIHGIDGTIQALLVGITRSDGAEKIQLGNVNKFYEVLLNEAISQGWLKTLVHKRNLQTLSRNLEYFKS